MRRILLIAAHADDETIGAGVLVSRVRDVRIVHATDGAPVDPSDAQAAGFATRENYARARRAEAVRALAKAGVRESAIVNLRFTDQRLVFELEELTFRILSRIEQLRPEVVLTHAYEGGHPDHDSLAFSCFLARSLFRMRSREEPFEPFEFTGYHAESGRMRPYEFLPYKEQKLHKQCLTPEQRKLKIEMLRTFESQSEMLKPFMLPSHETFRKAPRYDFSRPPHEGRLYYENFDWGVDGRAWRNLAARALTRLDLRRVAS
jgi:N-acetylglucosamine malate deacetylase 2